MAVYRHIKFQQHPKNLI